MHQTFLWLQQVIVFNELFVILELPFVGLFLYCIKVRCPISPTISDKEKKFYNIDTRTESVFMLIWAEICEKDLKSRQKWNLEWKEFSQPFS